MDPVTLAMGITAIADIAQTIQQYSNGTITQAQAHQQLIDAFGNVQSSIAQFEAAKPAAS